MHSCLWFIKSRSVKSVIKAVSVLVAAIFFIFTPDCGIAGSVEANPDPLLLIQGMVSIREQTPPSRLWLRATFSSPFIKNDDQYLAEFNQDKRRFINLLPDGKGKIMCEIAFDGKEVSLYDGVRSICVTDLGNATPGYVGYFFDPRILGITSWYQHFVIIANYNDFPSNTFHAELVGSEVIDGKKTWHVREVSSQVAFNWWIDGEHDFGVYRYEVDMGKQGTNIVNAFYENGYPWLPSQVDEKDFNGSGQVEREIHITIMKSSANVVFPADTWDFAGMNLPTNNLSVTDLRLHQIVGFWNGERVLPFKSAFPHTASPLSPPITTPRRTIFIVVMLILTVSPLFWLIRNHMRRS